MTSSLRSVLFAIFLVFTVSALWAGDSLPAVSWKRSIGEPLPNAGGRKPALSTNIDDGYWQGAPVGGFGAGTFSRTYRGDFARWHLKAGVHKYETVYTNQFAVFEQTEGSPDSISQVLMAGHPAHGELPTWKWDYPQNAGTYYSLYPKSWFDYTWDKLPAHLTLEQFSPILPDNYRETSYPIAVYRWHAENPSSHPVTVSVLLSWANMIGWLRDASRGFDGRLNAGNVNASFSRPLGSAGIMKGVLFDRRRPGDVRNDWDGQFAIATLESPGVEVTHLTTFSPDGGGAEVWSAFSKDGRLPNVDFNWTSSAENLAGAIAVRFTLQPGEKRVIPMVIAWDLPISEFGSGRQWYRHYTEFFGTSGKNAQNIAAEGLAHAAEWSDAIDRWQAPWITDSTKPDWYRAELFNELYILADGGSFWGRPVDDSKAPTTFSFMECYDYPYYSTLDVRFYGSMPLTKFWPDLDKREMRTFAKTVFQDEQEKLIWQWKSEQDQRPVFRNRKNKGAIPHDLGAPEEDPFFKNNQFSWQNTSDWKDLNTKFVLMIYRDYVFTGRTDKAFLEETWPAVQLSLEYLRQYDRDGDGIPENDGFPDQTYDEWVVRGTSAYCGGLWLAALRAAEDIAQTLGDSAAKAKYHELFERSRDSYIKKLWNGKYFRYDTGSQYKDDVQADQLAGAWYARITGLGDILPADMQRTTLQTIFDLNVMKLSRGEMGALNGIAPDGTILTSNQQVQEVWTGTTFSLAALMLSHGMKDQGYRTAWGVYHVVYETKGYWFRTPEAYGIDGMYRASMYMRPAAIWAMEMTAPPSAGNAKAGGTE
jgi:non-lysosomal glucosylceramidase